MWKSQAAFWSDFSKPRWEGTGLVAFLGEILLPPSGCQPFSHITIDSLYPQCAASRPGYGISRRSTTTPAWSDGIGRRGVTSLSPTSFAFVASTAP